MLAWGVSVTDDVASSSTVEQRLHGQALGAAVNVGDRPKSAGQCYKKRTLNVQLAERFEPRGGGIFDTGIRSAPITSIITMLSGHHAFRLMLVRRRQLSQGSR